MLLWKLFITFFRIGGFTIGGGYAMIPLIERDVVEKEGWLEAEEFLDMIAVAQSAPGVIAINSALIIGFKLAGIAGAAVSVLGAALPSFVIILVIATFFNQFKHLPLVESFMKGARPVVVALLFYAAYSMGRKGVKGTKGLVMGALALTAILFWGLNPILLIVIGGLAGLVLFKEKEKAGESE